MENLKMIGKLANDTNQTKLKRCEPVQASAQF